MYDVQTGGRGGCDKMDGVWMVIRGVDFPIKMWTSTGEGGGLSCTHFEAHFPKILRIIIAS